MEECKEETGMSIWNGVGKEYGGRRSTKEKEVERAGGLRCGSRKENK